MIIADSSMISSDFSYHFAKASPNLCPHGGEIFAAIPSTSLTRKKTQLRLVTNWMCEKASILPGEHIWYMLELEIRSSIADLDNTHRQKDVCS